MLRLCSDLFSIFNNIITIYRGTMARVKVTDIVKSYVGHATAGDFAKWMEKLELVIQVQNSTDNKASIFCRYCWIGQRLLCTNSCLTTSRRITISRKKP